MTLLADVAHATGHQFRDRSLLRAAFCHSDSANPEAHERFSRLAWLGDAIVYKMLTESLLEGPGSVGDLTIRRNKRKGEEHLARLFAEALDDDFISSQEAESSPGWQRIQAETLEALIGAIAEEAGAEAAVAAAIRLRI